IFSLRSNNPTNSSKLQRWSEIQNSPLSKNEKWRQRRFTYERQTPCERARCHLGDKRFRAIRNDRATSSTEGGRCPNDFDRPAIRKTSIDEAGKPIAVICHGSWLLVSAELTKGRTLTSYHTIQDDIRNSGGQWVDRE